MMPVLLVDKYRTISAANSAVRVRKCYGTSVCIVQEVLAGNGLPLGEVLKCKRSLQILEFCQADDVRSSPGGRMECIIREAEARCTK